MTPSFACLIPILPMLRIFVFLYSPTKYIQDDISAKLAKSVVLPTPKNSRKNSTHIPKLLTEMNSTGNSLNNKYQPALGLVK